MVHYSDYLNTEQHLLLSPLKVDNAIFSHEHMTTLNRYDTANQISLTAPQTGMIYSSKTRITVL